MRGFARVGVFVVAVLASGACVIFVLSTIENPYDDLQRAWSTVLAGITGLVALAAWAGFVLLRPPYDWDPHDPEPPEEDPPP